MLLEPRPLNTQDPCRAFNKHSKFPAFPASEVGAQLSGTTCDINATVSGPTGALPRFDSTR